MWLSGEKMGLPLNINLLNLLCLLKYSKLQREQYLYILTQARRSDEWMEACVSGLKLVFFFCIVDLFLSELLEASNIKIKSCRYNF